MTQLPWFPLWIDDLISSTNMQKINLSTCGAYLKSLRWVRREVSDLLGLIVHHNGEIITKSDLSRFIQPIHPERITKKIDDLFKVGLLGWDTPCRNCGYKIDLPKEGIENMEECPSCKIPNRIRVSNFREKIIQALPKRFGKVNGKPSESPHEEEQNCGEPVEKPPEPRTDCPNTGQNGGQIVSQTVQTGSPSEQECGKNCGEPVDKPPEPRTDCPNTEKNGGEPVDKTPEPRTDCPITGQNVGQIASQSVRSDKVGTKRGQIGDKVGTDCPHSVRPPISNPTNSKDLQNRPNSQEQTTTDKSVVVVTTDGQNVRQTVQPDKTKTDQNVVKFKDSLMLLLSVGFAKKTATVMASQYPYNRIKEACDTSTGKRKPRGHIVDFLRKGWV